MRKDGWLRTESKYVFHQAAGPAPSVLYPIKKAQSELNFTRSIPLIITTSHDIPSSLEAASISLMCYKIRSCFIKVFRSRQLFTNHSGASEKYPSQAAGQRG